MTKRLKVLPPLVGGSPQGRLEVMFSRPSVVPLLKLADAVTFQFQWWGDNEPCTICIPAGSAEGRLSFYVVSGPEFFLKYLHDTDGLSVTVKVGSEGDNYLTSPILSVPDTTKKERFRRQMLMTLGWQSGETVGNFIVPELTFNQRGELVRVCKIVDKSSEIVGSVVVAMILVYNNGGSKISVALTMPGADRSIEAPAGNSNSARLAIMGSPKCSTKSISEDVPLKSQNEALLHSMNSEQNVHDLQTPQSQVATVVNSTSSQDQNISISVNESCGTQTQDIPETFGLQNVKFTDFCGGVDFSGMSGISPLENNVEDDQIYSHASDIITTTCSTANISYVSKIPIPLRKNYHMAQDPSPQLNTSDCSEIPLVEVCCPNETKKQQASKTSEEENGAILTVEVSSLFLVSKSVRYTGPQNEKKHSPKSQVLFNTSEILHLSATPSVLIESGQLFIRLFCRRLGEKKSWKVGDTSMPISDIMHSEGRLIRVPLNGIWDEGSEFARHFSVRKSVKSSQPRAYLTFRSGITFIHCLSPVPALNQSLIRQAWSDDGSQLQSREGRTLLHESKVVACPLPSGSKKDSSPVAKSVELISKFGENINENKKSVPGAKLSLCNEFDSSLDPGDYGQLSNFQNLTSFHNYLRAVEIAGRSKAQSVAIHVQVLQARNLPGVPSEEGVLVAPSCYIKSTMGFSSFSTMVVKESFNPEWNFFTDVVFPGDQMNKNGGNVILKVFHSFSGIGNSPNDPMLGFICVDASSLWSGHVSLCGWYPVLDINGALKGHAKISLTSHESTLNDAHKCYEDANHNLPCFLHEQNEAQESTIHNISTESSDQLAAESAAQYHGYQPSFRLWTNSESIIADLKVLNPTSVTVGLQNEERQQLNSFIEESQNLQKFSQLKWSDNNSVRYPSLPAVFYKTNTNDVYDSLGNKENQKVVKMLAGLQPPNLDQDHKLNYLAGTSKYEFKSQESKCLSSCLKSQASHVANKRVSFAAPGTATFNRLFSYQDVQDESNFMIPSLRDERIVQPDTTPDLVDPGNINQERMMAFSWMSMAGGMDSPYASFVEPCDMLPGRVDAMTDTIVSITSNSTGKPLLDSSRDLHSSNTEEQELPNRFHTIEISTKYEDVITNTAVPVKPKPKIPRCRIAASLPFNLPR